MSDRGFTQWIVKRTDVGLEGAYYKAKTKGGSDTPPVQATTVVFADSLEEALAQGADLMGVGQHVLTATKIMSGSGVGE